MLRVYVLKINMQVFREREREYLSRLPAWRREKAERLIPPDARAASIGAWLLAEYVLEQEAGLRPGEYQITFTEKGKPVIRRDIAGVESDKHKSSVEGKAGAGDEPPVCFNISHAGEYAVCAAASYPLGIDVECKDDPKLRVARRMFAEQEKRRLGLTASEDNPKECISPSAAPDVSAGGQEEAGGGAEQMAVFRDIWTEKEAYLKFTGEGIAAGLDSFYKDEKTGEVMRRASERSDAADEGENETFIPRNCFISTVRIADGAYSLSVCSKEKNLVLDIRNLYEV